MPKFKLTIVRKCLAFATVTVEAPSIEEAENEFFNEIGQDNVDYETDDEWLDDAKISHHEELP